MNPDVHQAAIAEWRKTHSLLMDKERELSEVAVLHALGDAPVEKLDQLQSEVIQMRLKADTVFKEAFGVNRRK
jgi:hypothetical protein